MLHSMVMDNRRSAAVPGRSNERTTGSGYFHHDLILRTLQRPWTGALREHFPPGIVKNITPVRSVLMRIPPFALKSTIPDGRKGKSAA